MYLRVARVPPPWFLMKFDFPIKLLFTRATASSFASIYFVILSKYTDEFFFRLVDLLIFFSYVNNIFTRY